MVNATLPHLVCRPEFRVFLLLAISGLLSVRAAAPFLTLQFDSLEHEALQLSDVTVTLMDGSDESADFSVSAARLQLSPEQSFSDVQLQCSGHINAVRISCKEGQLGLEHPQLGSLQGTVAFVYNYEQGLQQARLQQLNIGGASIAAMLPGPAAPWRMSAKLDQLAVHELSTFLDLANLEPLPDTLAGGAVSGEIIARDWPLQNLSADLTFTDINYSDISVVQSLDGRLKVSLQRAADSWQGELDVSASAGELYIVPPLSRFEQPPGFYIAIGEQPLTLDAVFGYDNSQSRLVIQDMDFVHPEVMRLNLAGSMRFQPDFLLEGLSARMPLTQLEQVYPVYLQPWLIVTPYNDLAVGGRAGLELGYSGGNINALALTLEQADFADQRGRFAVTDLTTDVQMTAQRRHQSRISWGGLDVYRIGLGAGAIELASQDLNIAVTRWQDVPLLDGTLRIDELDLQGVGRPDFQLRLAGAVESVSLPALTAALDWPRLGGTLSGDLGGLVYTDGDIRMDGELLVRMFDGRVTIRDLEVLDLFGTLPVLKADIGVEAIDLEQLTETFAFGKITGGLSGYIRNLRLENWRPVAFDASLSTLEDGNKRHRISQKALNNLSQIGGGLQGALSRGFLAYFDEYSYGELGLSCRLANGFCELGGVKSYEQGHYLLTRGGLLPPWVEVKLGGSVISWDGLIQGFEQIAQGEVKIN